MLTYIHTFSNWKNYRSDEYLAENVDAAKSFMAKRLAQKLEKKPSELTPEEREESLKDKAFSRIMELTKDSTGYALPMVKFHFDQGIPIGNSIER